MSFRQGVGGRGVSAEEMKQLASTARTGASTALAASFAAADAPPAVATGVPRPPRGVALPRGAADLHFSLQQPRPDEGCTPLQATDIAVVPEVSLAHPRSRCVAMTSQYLSYGGLKKDQIRVIRVLDGAKTLVKCHTQPIADLAASPIISSLLASASADGTVALMKFTQPGAGEPIEAEILFQLRFAPFPGEPDSPARLAWHPEDPGTLYAAAGAALFVLTVVPLAHAFAAAGREILDCTDVGRLPDGCALLTDLREQAISAIAVSPTGLEIAVGGAAGSAIYVLPLDSRTSAVTLSCSDAPAAVSALGFFSAAADEDGAASAAAPPWVMLAAGEGNRVLRLFRVDLDADDDGSRVRLVQSVTLAAASDDRIQVRCNAAARLVIVTSSVRPEAYALHVSEDGRFDHWARCGTGKPTVSFADDATHASTLPPPSALQLLVMQLDTVKRFDLPLDLWGTAPPPPAPRPDAPEAPPDEASHLQRGGIGSTAELPEFVREVLKAAETDTAAAANEVVPDAPEAPALGVAGGVAMPEPVPPDAPLPPHSVPLNPSDVAAAAGPTQTVVPSLVLSRKQAESRSAHPAASASDAGVAPSPSASTPRSRVSASGRKHALLTPSMLMEQSAAHDAAPSPAAAQPADAAAHAEPVNGTESHHSADAPPAGSAAPAAAQAAAAAAPAAAAAEAAPAAEAEPAADDALRSTRPGARRRGARVPRGGRRADDAADSPVTGTPVPAAVGIPAMMLPERPPSVGGEVLGYPEPAPTMGVVAALAGMESAGEGVAPAVAALRADVTQLRDAVAECRTWGEDSVGALRRETAELRALILAETSRIATAQTAAQRATTSLQTSIKSLASADRSAALAASVQSAVREALPAIVEPALMQAFAAAFRDAIVPAFESAVRDLFGQVSAALEGGLKEHLAASTALAASQAERVDAALAALEARVLAAPTALAAAPPPPPPALAPSVSPAHLSDLEAPALSTLSKQPPSSALSDIVGLPFPFSGGEKLGAPSAGAPQAPGQAPRGAVLAEESLEGGSDADQGAVYTRLAALLAGGQYAETFTAALNEGDPAVVNWLCQQVTPQRADPLAQLSEIVLLSLMQQLSVSIGESEPEQLRRQLDWIEHGCGCLDPETSQFKANIVPVLHEVNDAIKVLTQTVSDRGLATMAVRTGRIVCSKLRSMEA